MKQDTGFVEAGTLTRSGPIGRLLRFVFGLMCAWFLMLIMTDTARTAARFPNIMELWPGIFFALYLFSYVINIGFGRQWGRWPQIVILSCTAAAAFGSFAAYGIVWGPPLAWFIMAWVSYLYTHLAISFFLSAVLATPGCEMRALPHLIAKLGNRAPLEHDCPVGPLSRIDAWEAGRKLDSKLET